MQIHLHMLCAWHLQFQKMWFLFFSLYSLDFVMRGMCTSSESKSNDTLFVGARFGSVFAAFGSYLM